MEVSHILSRWTFFGLISALVVRGYPAGPPPSTCMAQFPKHHAEKQASTCPYHLVFSNSEYSPGQNITVTLVSRETDRTFKGFQITAHRTGSSGNSEEYIGTFTVTDTLNSKTLACKAQPNTMLAHNNGNNKTSVSGIWTAPTFNPGDLWFSLTVVETLTEFWHNVTFPLAPTNLDNLVQPDHKVPGVASSGVASPDWRGCGQSKGCWLVTLPGSSNCSGSDCKAALSYARQGNSLVMEMAVKGHDNYISVGFSHDKLMGDDQTVLCTAKPDHPSVQVGYNPGQFNDQEFTAGISNLMVSQVDGQAVCRFTRQMALSSLLFNGSSTTFDLNHPFYLFLAWGPIYKGTAVAGKHTEAPAVSLAKVDLTAVAVETLVLPSEPSTTPDPSSSATVLLPAGFLLHCLLSVTLVFIGTGRER